MKIGFTGTQAGMTDLQKKMVLNILKTLNISEIHAGDCIGADADFYDIAFSLGVKTIGHIPEVPDKRAFKEYTEVREPKPYLVRNRDIVNESDLLLSTPKESEEVMRSGTWATIRYGLKIGEPTIIIWPNGTWKASNFKNLWKLNP
jgi:hypothetical protein